MRVNGNNLIKGLVTTLPTTAKPRHSWQGHLLAANQVCHFCMQFEKIHSGERSIKCDFAHWRKAKQLQNQEILGSARPPQQPIKFATIAFNPKSLISCHERRQKSFTC